MKMNSQFSKFILPFALNRCPQKTQREVTSRFYHIPLDSHQHVWRRISLCGMECLANMGSFRRILIRRPIVDLLFTHSFASPLFFLSRHRTHLASPRRVPRGGRHNSLFADRPRTSYMPLPLVRYRKAPHVSAAQPFEFSIPMHNYTCQH